MTELQNHQLIHSSASAEWFTPPCYIKAVREVLGAIDLDPASSLAANRIVQAARYFTETDNGYTREWHGKLFLNPPYGWCYPDGRRKEKGGISSQGHWTKRLIAQYRAGTVTEAILLVNANTGEQWFQALWDFPICFVNRRIRFIPGEGTDPRKQPTKSNVFVYFGPRPERFTEVFGQFGQVVLPEIVMISPLQAHDVLAPPTHKKGYAKLETVEKWLRATLANGPLVYETLKKEAEGLGISIGTLRRAKKRLGVKSKKRIYQGE